MTTTKNLKVSAIICAAGSGKRAGFNENKLLHPLMGAPALYHTLKKFDIPEVDEVIVTSSAFDIKSITALAAPFNYKVIAGGATRTESVSLALVHVTGDIVLIHDGARPFVTQKLIKECIDCVERFGSGICALPVTDTLAGVNYGLITTVPDRSSVMRLQTPQGFFTDEIRRAYSFAGGQSFYDDSSVYAAFIGKPHVVAGDVDNIKLTYASDFERYLPPVTPPAGKRAGIGVDVHSFGEGNFVTLGGVKIPCDRGIIAHSDGDVIMHALCDSLFSAAGLEDIGRHFPDSDPAYAGADSVKLFKCALKEVKNAGYVPTNISITVQAEKPKLAPHTAQMKQNIARAAGLDESAVAIAAGTSEGLGFVGEGLGICAYALTVLDKG